MVARGNTGAPFSATTLSLNVALSSSSRPSLASPLPFRLVRLREAIGKAHVKVCFNNCNGCFEGWHLATGMCAPGRNPKLCPNRCTTAAVWAHTPPLAPFMAYCVPGTALPIKSKSNPTLGPRSRKMNTSAIAATNLSAALSELTLTRDHRASTASADAPHADSPPDDFFKTLPEQLPESLYWLSADQGPLISAKWGGGELQQYVQWLPGWVPCRAIGRCARLSALWCTLTHGRSTGHSGMVWMVLKRPRRQLERLTYGPANWRM